MILSHLLIFSMMARNNSNFHSNLIRNRMSILIWLVLSTNSIYWSATANSLTKILIVKLQLMDTSVLLKMTLKVWILLLKFKNEKSLLRSTFISPWLFLLKKEMLDCSQEYLISRTLKLKRLEIMCSNSNLKNKYCLISTLIMLNLL